MQAGGSKENKMGVMPVGKLLVSMSVPMMASMLVMALYNIIDSMFVSRISENALTALSMACTFGSLSPKMRMSRERITWALRLRSQGSSWCWVI